MNNAILGILGLCRKAGLMSAGFEAVKASILSKKSKLVLAASDISAKTYKELNFFAKDHNIEVIRLDEDTEAVSKAIGLRAGTISIEDGSFAKKILELHSQVP